MRRTQDQVVSLIIPRDAFRQTLPRQQVLEVFTRHPLPMTVAEVHRRLQDRRINRASVYRAIHLFCRLGILTTAGHIAEGRRFELSDNHRAHHHHLICERCGGVIDFEECALGAFERRIRQQTRFQVRRHELQFFGLCWTCS